MGYAGQHLSFRRHWVHRATRCRNIDTGFGRPQISIYVAPTAQADPNPRIAACGTWLIELKNIGSEVAVEAWVQRGDTPFGYPLAGRQSRFDDPDYVCFTPSGREQQNDVGPSPIRRRGTVNALATGQHTIVVGGYRASDRMQSKYTGAGPVGTPPDGSSTYRPRRLGGR